MVLLFACIGFIFRIHEPLVAWLKRKLRPRSIPGYGRISPFDTDLELAAAHDRAPQGQGVGRAASLRTPSLKTSRGFEPASPEPSSSVPFSSQPMVMGGVSQPLGGLTRGGASSSRGRLARGSAGRAEEGSLPPVRLEGVLRGGVMDVRPRVSGAPGVREGGAEEEEGNRGFTEGSSGPSGTGKKVLVFEEDDK